MGDYRLDGDLETQKTVHMPQVYDRLGKLLDHILVIPMFGNQYKFTSVDEMLAFIENVPEKTPRGDLKFQMLKITILYQNGSDLTMRYQDKNDVVLFLKFLFGKENAEA